MSSNQVKKAEYDFVPTLALSVVVLSLIVITVVAVAFIWSVLNKATTDAVFAKRGNALATVVRVIGDKSEIFNVLDYRKNDARLVLQGGVVKVGKKQYEVDSIGKAMQRLVANPSYVSVLPPVKETKAPAPRRAAPRKAPVPRKAPAPRRAAPQKAPAPRQAAPTKRAPAKRAAAPTSRPAAPANRQAPAPRR